jgi:hypothetical protein
MGPVRIWACCAGTAVINAAVNTKALLAHSPHELREIAFALEAPASDNAMGARRDERL